MFIVVLGSVDIRWSHSVCFKIGLKRHGFAVIPQGDKRTGGLIKNHNKFRGVLRHALRVLHYTFTTVLSLFAVAPLHRQSLVLCWKRSGALRRVILCQQSLTCGCYPLWYWMIVVFFYLMFFILAGLLTSFVFADFYCWYFFLISGKGFIERREIISFIEGRPPELIQGASLN